MSSVRLAARGDTRDYDTDVSHYSISELIDLVGLRGIDNIAENEFSDIIAGFVDKYRTVDETLSRFFADVGQRLYAWLTAGGEGGGEGLQLVYFLASDQTKHIVNMYTNTYESK